MTLEGIKEKFGFYRKWLRTLLIKEFMNLPLKNQKNFITLIEKFLSDCKRVHEEAKNIKEKEIEIIVEKIIEPDKEESYLIKGIVKETGESIKTYYPIGNKKPPEIIKCIVYSLDNQKWFSSKEELISQRSSK